VLTPAAESRALRRKTAIFTTVVIVSNVCGNFMLSIGMRQVGRTVTGSPLPYLAALLNPFVAAGVCLLACWLFSNLSLLSWADLSYVLPVTAIAYVLIALLGHFALGERVPGLHWAGILAITAGAVLVGRTTPTTTPVHREEDDE
jgi:uncharacterized membrane protein